MMETYWIYTNEGVKVGEFNVDVVSMITSYMMEDEFIAAKFSQACQSQGIDPTDHNYCIAAA